MKVFHQTGHNWSWNRDSLFEDKDGDGLILSPVNIPVSTIEKLSLSQREVCMFDPQVYIPSTIRGKLEGYDYYPANISPADVDTLEHGSLADESASRCVNYQEQMEFGSVVIPTKYFSAIPSNYYGQLTDNYVRPFLDHTTSGIPVYLTVLVKPIQLKDESMMTDLLNWITSFQSIIGVYLIFEKEGLSKQIKDGVLLANSMKFIAFLKKSGLKVIVGYCNTESVLYLAAGADVVTMGAYENVRSFNISRFELAKKGGGAPTPRVYCSRLLQWVEHTYIDAFDSMFEGWGSIKDVSSYTYEMFTPSFNWHFTKPAIYKHFFEVFTEQVEGFNQSDSPIDAVELVIRNAIENFNSIEEAGVALDSNSDGSHLPHWLNALSLFRSGGRAI